MLTWWIKKQLTAFEQQWSYDLSYARFMLSVNPTALIRFQRATAIGQHRDGVQLEPWFAAKITATAYDDCGPCTQLAVQMAERAGVPALTIEHLLSGEFEALPQPVALVARYTLCTLNRSPEADALREQVVTTFGQQGLVSLALVITGARLYPSLKYALGYGHACQQVQVGGKAVPRGVGLSPALSSRFSGEAAE